jgi:hypothetical protein
VGDALVGELSFLRSGEVAALKLNLLGVFSLRSGEVAVLLLAEVGDPFLGEFTFSFFIT